MATSFNDLSDGLGASIGLLYVLTIVCVIVLIYVLTRLPPQEVSGFNTRVFKLPSNSVSNAVESGKNYLEIQRREAELRAQLERAQNNGRPYVGPVKVELRRM